MSKQKYVLTHAIRGSKPRAVGSIVELTEEQAAHPLYRNRTRKADITPAVAPEEGDKNKPSSGGGGKDKSPPPSGSSSAGGK